MVKAVARTVRGTGPWCPGGAQAGASGMSAAEEDAVVTHARVAEVLSTNVDAQKGIVQPQA